MPSTCAVAAPPPPTRASRRSGPRAAGTGRCREARAPAAAAEQRQLTRERRPPLRERCCVGLLHAGHVDHARPRAAAERRGAVDAPGDLDAEHVGDRREDVEGRHVPRVDHLALLLAGVLDEQRREAELGQVLARRPPAQVAAAEADPVVGRDDHERLVPEPDPVQARDEPAEQLVRVAHLQQVPLPRLRRELPVEPELAVAAGGVRARHRSRAAVREVQPGVSG